MNKESKKGNIGIIVYGNPNHYPSTLNAIWLLEKEYKVHIFCRNTGYPNEKHIWNSACYRFGKNVEVEESEKKFFILKFAEYLMFIFKTCIYLSKFNRTLLITYDPYSLLTALVYKLLNNKANIFYHEHELAILNKPKLTTLRYWVQLLAYKNIKKCVWVSQPDVKRKEYFEKFFNLNNVKTMRNWGLKGFSHSKEKNELCKKLRSELYVIAAYIGTLGDDFFVNELIEYIKETSDRVAIVLAGWLRNQVIHEKLRDEINGLCGARMLYLGHISDYDKHVLLNSADFALVLYKYEKTTMAEMNAGSSAKIGEYLAFGLPIIYPKWWEYEEYYKEIGLSYKDGNELVERIKQMSSDLSLRQRLSAKAKELFNEKLNFEYEFTEMRKLIDFYQSR